MQSLSTIKINDCVSFSLLHNDQQCEDDVDNNHDVDVDDDEQSSSPWIFGQHIFQIQSYVNKY